MQRLLENAQKILETAEFSSSSAVTSLMRGGRPLGMTTSNDWSLSALLAERGADEAYRVTRTGGRLVVEGRSATQRCLLANTPASAAAHTLLTPPTALALRP